jgi:hypothetical protein
MAAGCDRAGSVADTGRCGIATLVLGTVTVAAPSVTANSVIFLTPQSGLAPLALPYVSGLTPGTGFTITSLNATDTAHVGWFIVEHS